MYLRERQPGAIAVRGNAMKYMLLMNSPVEGLEPITTWAPGDVKGHIQFMHDFAAELTASGEWVDGQGLAFPEQAKIVRAQPNGGFAVTDGPFPETKEFLAGYWIVDCETPDRAIELAAKASAAPGPNGAPINIPIEVREVMSAPGEEM
jgi:hypothetical protein